MSQEKPYVLGTDQVELDRLKLQHDLWKDHLIRLWKKSNITAVDISETFSNFQTPKIFLK